MPTRDERLAYNRAYYQQNKHKWNKRTPEQQAAYNAKRRAEYVNNPAVREKVAAQGKVYRAKRDPEKRKAAQYNLDVYELELATDRGCAICGAKFAASGNGTAKRHIDHDHRTGRTRGVLCQACNLAIGHMADDPIIAAAALRYLLNGGDSALEA